MTSTPKTTDLGEPGSADGPARAAPSGPSAEEFSDRLFGAILGAQFVQAAYLGDRLGFYAALASGRLRCPRRRGRRPRGPG